VDAVDAAAADLDPGQELGFIVDPTIGNLGNDYPEFLAQLNAIGDRYEVGVTAIIPEKGQDTIDAVEQYLRGGKNRIVRGVIDSSSGSAYNDRFANIAERIQLVGVNVPPTGCDEIPLMPILTSSFTGDTAGLNDIPGIKVHPAGGGVVMSIVDVLPPAAGEEINTDDLHFRYRLNAALLRNA